MTTIPDIRPDYDVANYDVSKIAPYTLEDPLTFCDGTKVASPADWPRRRAEILDIFAKKMFGQEPPKPATMVTEVINEKDGAAAGFAVRTIYRMWFKEDKSGPYIDWMVIRPRHAKTPSPVILFLNYTGNHQLLQDEDIPIPDTWCRTTEDKKLPPERGLYQKTDNRAVFPIGILLSAGYAVMTACYCQVSPDPDMAEPDPKFSQENFAYTGVFDLWGKRDESRDDNPTALGAWAWALSRGLDLAERIPEIDAKNNIVTGFSRLAKAAVIATARDERFQICVADQCGGGGITLAKRDFGENIGTEVKMFQHWYCKAYKQYARNPAQLLDFDQHLLAASIAPRKLLVTGFNSPWFDTEGEYLSCKAASPAWELFGLPGFPNVPYPDTYDTSAIGPYLGYFRRTEDHGLAAYDWWQLLKFAGN